MKRRPLFGTILEWAVGPLAVMVLAAALGESQRSDRRGTLAARTAALPDAELRKLEAIPAAALANAAWAFGNRDAVLATTRVELERHAGGPERARALLRLALVDDNFDGQAALIAQACVADARVCAHPADVAAQEAKQRFVSPGNRLPLSLSKGHPSTP